MAAAPFAGVPVVKRARRSSLMTLERQPTTILFLLAETLPVSDILRLCESHPEMAHICRSDALWRRLAFRDHPFFSADAAALAMRVGWQRVYHIGSVAQFFAKRVSNLAALRTGLHFQFLDRRTHLPAISNNVASLEEDDEGLIALDLSSAVFPRTSMLPGFERLESKPPGILTYDLPELTPGIITYDLPELAPIAQLVLQSFFQELLSNFFSDGPANLEVLLPISSGRRSYLLEDICDAEGKTRSLTSGEIFDILNHRLQEITNEHLEHVLPNVHHKTSFEMEFTMFGLEAKEHEQLERKSLFLAASITGPVVTVTLQSNHPQICTVLQSVVPPLALAPHPPSFCAFYIDSHHPSYLALLTHIFTNLVVPNLLGIIEQKLTEFTLRL